MSPTADQGFTPRNCFTAGVSVACSIDLKCKCAGLPSIDWFDPNANQGLSMSIKLYYAPYACSIVPLVAFSEANADVEVCPINIRKKHHMTTEYRALNPKHKVPLLVVDGRPLSENVAILLWISRRFPEAGLLPVGDWQQAQAISILGWCASGIHPHISRYNAPQKFCDLSGTQDSVRRLAERALRDSFQLANEQLAGRVYFFDRFSIADVYFFWCFRRTGMFDLDLAEFPNCQTHFEKLLARRSIQEALEFESSVISQFEAA
ncbi:MAG: glutathione S-transferase family protein [Hyphomicrobiaceae bacterium]